jgi:putrescine aminotransferase
MPTLLSIEDCDHLSIDETVDLYRRHLNPSQVDPLSPFGFGKELVSRAMGSIIHTASGRRITDFTAALVFCSMDTTIREFYELARDTPP